LREDGLEPWVARIQTNAMAGGRPRRMKNHTWKNKSNDWVYRNTKKMGSPFGTILE